MNWSASPLGLVFNQTTMYKIKELFSRNVVEGENPRKLFCIPVFLRRDGAVFRVGSIVHIIEGRKNLELKFCIKDILVSYDLEQVKIFF